MTTALESGLFGARLFLSPSLSPYSPESNDEVHLVRNHGNAKAVLHVTFIVPTSTPPEGLLVDEPQPKGCNVR
jgi:hypothetical protein